MHGLGWVIGVDLDRLGVMNRAEGAERGWLIATGSSLLHHPAKLLELSGVGDVGGKLEVLATAGVHLLEGAAHRNDAVQPRHLQFEVGVDGDRHEFGIARTPKDGAV
jgi:hypothetical protein